MILIGLIYVQLIIHMLLIAIMNKKDMRLLSAKNNSYIRINSKKYREYT